VLLQDKHSYLAGGLKAVCGATAQKGDAPGRVPSFPFLGASSTIHILPKYFKAKWLLFVFNDWIYMKF
jgi:hypothetical protein